MNFNDLSKTLKDQLKAAKELASNRLLRPNFFGNVVGVGIGEKVVDGDPTGNACVRIYVQSKLDLDDLTPAYLLPSSFLDIPTDIIPVGRLGLAKVVGKDPEAPIIRPGSSIRVESKHSNLSSGAVGTLGAIVKVNGDRYILGCNHILNVNGRVNQDSKAEIVSGDLGFGKASPKIATPDCKLFVQLKRNAKNYTDCALAKVDEGLLQDAESLAAEQAGEPGRPKLQAQFPKEIGSVDSIVAVDASVGQKVRKAGAVTGVTKGVVVDIDADFYVDYGFGTFLFTNQVVIDGKEQGNFKDKDQFKDIFATDGDSGAIVVDEQNRAVAMLFAEAGRFAVACPFSKVLEEIARLLSSERAADPKPPELRKEPVFEIINTLKKETGATPRSSKYKK